MIIPLQDVLGLGGSARMNVPGRGEGNWCWRFQPDQLDPKVHDRLADLTAVYDRWNGEVPAKYDPAKPRVAEEPPIISRAGPVAPAAKPAG